MGASAIADGIKNNVTLKTLQLSNCCIDEKGGLALERALRQNCIVQISVQETDSIPQQLQQEIAGLSSDGCERVTDSVHLYCAARAIDRDLSERFSRDPDGNPLVQAFREGTKLLSMEQPVPVTERQRVLSLVEMAVGSVKSQPSASNLDELIHRAEEALSDWKGRCSTDIQVAQRRLTEIHGIMREAHSSLDPSAEELPSASQVRDRLCEVLRSLENVRERLDRFPPEPTTLLVQALRALGCELTRQEAVLRS